MSLKRYSLWDKKTPVVCPSGEVFTPEQWIERYPVAAFDNVHIVGGAGLVNGSYYGVLEQMVEMYSNQGCNFTDCTTPLEFLERIEEFEDWQAEQAAIPSDISTPEERIAAALETQVMLSMVTVNDDDPDLD